MEQIFDFLARHWFLTGTFVLLLIWLLQTGSSKVVQGMELLTAAEAINKVNHENGIFVDIRGNEQFDNGHIVNSLNIPLADLENNLKKLAKAKKKPVIVVCQIGQSAIKGAKLLKDKEFDSVYVLQGGIREWSSASLPLVQSK